MMLKARWHAREQAPDTEVPLSCQVLAIASGKGGVGKSSVTVNLAAALAATGTRVGVLDADIWGFSVPRLLGITDRMEAKRVDGSDKPKIIPNERRVGAGMLEGRVDRLPRRRGDGADVARADAHQGGRAVPARRALGRPRLPAHRHAAGHRRRADGARPAAPAHRPRDRHHAGARRPEGRPAGGRHGAAQLPARRRRDREHERVHVRPRRRRTRCSVRAAGGRSPTRSTPRCSVRSRSSRRSPPAATRARRSSIDGDRRRGRRVPRDRRADRRRDRAAVVRRRPSTWRAARRGMLDAVEIALGPKR